jgi:uncharacterized protein YbjQ (UPF0145 family)
MPRPADDIILTTSYQVAGRTIEGEIDVLSAQCTYGMNIFRDFFAGIRDLVVASGTAVRIS